MTPLGIFVPYRASTSKALDNSSCLSTTFLHRRICLLPVFCPVRYSLHHPNNAIPTPYQSLRIAAHHPRALKLPPLLLPKLSDTQLRIPRPSPASNRHMRTHTISRPLVHAPPQILLRPILPPSLGPETQIPRPRPQVFRGHTDGFRIPGRAREHAGAQHQYRCVSVGWLSFQQRCEDRGWERRRAYCR